MNTFELFASGFVTTFIFLNYIDWVKENVRIIGNNYMTRYFIIPRNPWFNIYLHRYTGSDDDRALHDHPWRSVSFLLKGELQEHSKTDHFDTHKSVNREHTYYSGERFGTCETTRITAVYRFLPKFRSAKYTHRIELMSDTAWTLFFTGPKIREWGFHCPKGWVHWRQFTDRSGNNIGRGCE